MDYRIKRARFEQNEMPAAARRGLAGAEYGEPFAPYEPAENLEANPAWANPLGLDEPTAEMQTAGEFGTSFETEIASPPMTVSLPLEWLAEAASANTESPEILSVANTPLHALASSRSQTRHATPTRSYMIARVQRARSLTSDLGAAALFPVSRPTRIRAQSPIPSEHAQSLEVGASTGAQVPSPMTEVGIPPVASRVIRESVASAAAPVWPFSLVTPHIARVAANTPAYDDSEEEALLPSATEIAPMVVRRSALQTPLAHAAPGLPALSSPVRPAGQMLAHVPVTELDLGREMSPLVQRREVVEPQIPLSTNASLLRYVRLPNVRRRDEKLQIRAASDFVSPELETKPMSSAPGSTAQMPKPGLSSSAVTVLEWPVLTYVQPSAPQEPEGAEPPAIQVLRRRGPTAQISAMAILSTLPSLGRGAPLPEAVRRPMETLLGRDLSAVETHESAVAESLGAEAFTSGQRIVFAPGRLDYRSARGLAVVGHELTHVGQPLAFREWSVSAAMDAAENTARQQETQIEQSLTQNWPNAPHMEVLQATQALRSLVSRGGAAAGAGVPAEAAGGGAAAGELSAGNAASGGQAAGGAATTGSGGAAAGGSEPVATARLSEAPSGPTGDGAKAGAQNIDQLAHEVYDLLKVRLRGELMRHTLYS